MPRQSINLHLGAPKLIVGVLRQRFDRLIQGLLEEQMGSIQCPGERLIFASFPEPGHTDLDKNQSAEFQLVLEDVRSGAARLR